MSDNTTMAWTDSILKRVIEVHSPEYRDGLEKKYRFDVSRVDSDLASSKSLSLSAVQRIQKGRDITRQIEREREDMLNVYKRATGSEWKP